VVVPQKWKMSPRSPIYRFRLCFQIAERKVSQYSP